MLIDRLREFFNSLSETDKQKHETRRDDAQIASVALFHHIIEADGVIDESEKSRLKEILAVEFNINMGEAVSLYHAGKIAGREAVDFYSFTSVLKLKLDESQKINLVEIMWDLAYADGHRHELEDHIIWRISDLLGISGRQRVLARQRIETERKASS